ncbi:MAG: hypothetical protein AAFQ14_05180 [Cyanobacteria bacterium J06621_12]
MSQRIYGGQIVKVVKQRCQPHLSFFANKSVTIVLFQPPSGLTNEQMLAQYNAAVTSTNQKVKTFSFLGCKVNRISLPASTSAREFREILADAAAASRSSLGIIVQNPVPSFRLRAEIAKIPPQLDIDGINETSIFQASATSEAISRLVSDFAQGGDRVAVVGSMGFVGSGVIKLLQSSELEIIELDKSKGDTDTKIKQGVRDADLVVTATGKANLIQPDYLKSEHKLVIDAAFIPQPDGTILGDISKDAYDIPEYLTPVPGGIGPTQMAVLLERIMKVAQIEIQPWDYHQDILEPLKKKKAGEISDHYGNYAVNVTIRGLAGAKEIAKNALDDGVELKQVAQMLMDNNPAYQELVAKSSAAQAQKIIITKAQAELAVSKKGRSSETKSPKQNRGRGRS